MSAEAYEGSDLWIAGAGANPNFTGRGRRSLAYAVSLGRGRQSLAGRARAPFNLFALVWNRLAKGAAPWCKASCNAGGSCPRLWLTAAGLETGCPLPQWVLLRLPLMVSDHSYPKAPEHGPGGHWLAHVAVNDV